MAPTAPAAETPVEPAPQQGPVIDEVVLPDSAPTPEVAAPATAPAPAPKPTSEETNESNADKDISQIISNEIRFDRADNTAIGGYGEIQFHMAMPEGGGARDNEVDITRLVLFVAHRFNEKFRVYLELEVEHALVQEGATGGFEVEQAYVDWKLRERDELLNFRAGLILVPMGIVNQWHEPTIFNSVERPRVDTLVIPTTWREAGVGLWGRNDKGFSYEFYVMSGLDASGFSATTGIRAGRTSISQAPADGPAFSARAQWEPILGMVFGGAAYAGWASGKLDNTDANIFVVGSELDWRIRRKGWEARALVAQFHVSNTDALRVVPPGETVPISTVGKDIFGTYAELGYNVLFPANTDHELVPFVRVEYYDTTFQESDPLINAAGFVEYVMGLSYRPIPQIVFKTDFIIRRSGATQGNNLWNLGIGWAF